MSYSETEWGLLLCSIDAVPGLPAYTWADWPFGLNGAFAFAEFPGVVVKFWQLVLPVPPAVPGCPGPLGLGFAPAVPARPSTGAIANTPTTAIFRTNLIFPVSPLSRGGRRPPVARGHQGPRRRSAPQLHTDQEGEEIGVRHQKAIV